MEPVECEGIEGCKGTYILLLKNHEDKEVMVGSLGKIRFQKGIYAYIGSARGPGGVRARLCRHVKGSGRIRWHIDYLRRITVVVGYVYSCEGPPEHIIAQNCTRLMKPVVEGFGSTDDPYSKTHLFYCKGTGEECIKLARKCLGETNTT